MTNLALDNARRYLRSAATIVTDKLPEGFPRDLLAGSASYVRDQLVAAISEERTSDVQAILQETFNPAFDEEANIFVVLIGSNNVNVFVHFPTDTYDEVAAEFTDGLFLWLANLASLVSCKCTITVRRLTDADTSRDNIYLEELEKLARARGVWGDTPDPDPVPA